MATIILPAVQTNVVPAAAEWAAIDARALELFCTNRNLEMDDSVLAALCEARDADATRRALRLIESNGNLSFSLAFKIVRTTDRYFDQADDVAVLLMPQPAPYALPIAA